MCKHKLLSLPGKCELPGYCAGGGRTGVGGTGGGCIIHSSLAFTFDIFRYHFCRTTSFSWQTELQGSGPRSGKQQLEPPAHGSATSAAPAHRGAPGPAGGSSVNTQSPGAVLAQSDTAARRQGPGAAVTPQYLGAARRSRSLEELRGRRRPRGLRRRRAKQCALLTPTPAAQDPGLLGLGPRHVPSCHSPDPSRISHSGRSCPGTNTAPGAVAAAGAPQSRSERACPWGHVTESPTPAPARG